MSETEARTNEVSTNGASLNELKEQYVFYILNPARKKGVNYSFYIREDDGEYPIINSNTGGIVTFNSRSEEWGDAIELSDEFFHLLGRGFHEAMCFLPEIYFRDNDSQKSKFERLTVNTVYDGKPREHEVWLAFILIDWMCREGEVMPELRPLCEWANGFSEFGMPRLGSGVSNND